MKFRATTRPTALEEVFADALKQKLDADPDHCFKEPCNQLFNVYIVEKDNKKTYFSNKVKAERFAKLAACLIVCAAPALRAEEVEVDVSVTFREAVSVEVIQQLPEVYISGTRVIIP